MKRSIIKVGTLKPTSRPRAKRPSWYHPAFGLAVLLTVLPVAVHAQTTELPEPADEFVDSIGINPPIAFQGGKSNSNGKAPDASYYGIIKSEIVSLGVRHLRFTPPDSQTAQDLAQSGLTCLYKSDALGTENTTTNSATIKANLDDLFNDDYPLAAIEGVEGPNEPDTFWPLILNIDGSPASFGAHSYTTATGVQEGYDKNTPIYLNTYPQPHTLDLSGIVQGTTDFMKDLYSQLSNYNDPRVASLPIVGLSFGGTYDPSANPWGTGKLGPYVTYGNFHPYPGGDYASQHVAYDTINYLYDSNKNVIPGTDTYLHRSNEPSVGIDGDDLQWENNLGNTSVPAPNGEKIVPLDFSADQPPYIDSNGKNVPMYSTEDGYESGSGIGEISYTVQAKYIPRLLAENFRTNFSQYYLDPHQQQPSPGSGIVRTYLFELADDPDNPAMDWGLLTSYKLQPSLQAKPAFTALQSLISLLKESGETNIPTSTLTYNIKVNPVLGYTEPISHVVSDYDRTWYVHHLLLQKSDGDYYLLLWHEISDENTNYAPFKEIKPPLMPTTVTLPASIGSVTEFDYDGNWNLQPKPLTITGGQVSVNVPDQIMVLRLTPAAAEAAFNGPHTISPTATTTVQAEDYDIGGYGTAYTAYFQPGASFSAYRPDDLVGIGSTYKAGPLGYYVGWMAQGQFLNYTVTVPEAGNYLLAFRYASGDTSNGNNFSVLDQATGQTTNPIPVSYSGVNGSYPWDTWANTAPVEMALNYGQQTLRLNENTGGYNLDYMTFTRDMNSYPFSVPGGFSIASRGTSTVKTSDFDLGGQDVAYNNTYNDPGNYSAYRHNDQVGLWPCLDTGGGYEVAWTAPGQWLKYTVNVAAAGTYAVTFRVASASSTNTAVGSFHLQDATSNNLTGPVTFNGTGGWDNWAPTAPLNVTFATAGTQTVTLWEDTGNYNINTMTFNAGDTGTAFSSGGATSGTALKLGGGMQLAAAGTDPISAQNAFDSSLNTYFASAASAGYVGQDAGKAVPVTQITYAPRPGYETRMVGGVFEGSNTSTTTGYTTLATVASTPKDGMVNLLTVTSGKTYRYLRYRSPANGYCDVAEIKFQN